MEAQKDAYSWYQIGTASLYVSTTNNYLYSGFPLLPMPRYPFLHTLLSSRLGIPMLLQQQIRCSSWSCRRQVGVKSGDYMPMVWYKKVGAQCKFMLGKNPIVISCIITVIHNTPDTRLRLMDIELVRA